MQIAHAYALPQPSPLPYPQRATSHALALFQRGLAISQVEALRGEQALAPAGEQETERLLGRREQALAAEGEHEYEPFRKERALAAGYSAKVRGSEPVAVQQALNHAAHCVRIPVADISPYSCSLA